MQTEPIIILNREALLLLSLEEIYEVFSFDPAPWADADSFEEI